jgi:predicted RNase H-like HicB family nuclease
MKILEYSVILHQAEEGGFWLEVPALEGCVTQGETVEETLKNAEEAIRLYLDAIKEVGQKVPQEEKLIFARVGVSI